MIKALIVDDEIKARKVLRHYLSSFVPDVSEIRDAESAAVAADILQVYKPDILFLDVEMPHKNGFQFLSEITDPAFDVIFTTAFNQYAIQAIRFSALDYLLKPLDLEELKAAVQRHIEKKEEKSNQQELYNNLIDNLRKKDVKDFKLAVAASDGLHFFMIQDILRLEANKSYTHIHLIDQKPFISSRTLKHFEDMLEEFNFIRTHKSHLVNPRHITRMTSDNEFVLLTDGTKVEVSRRRKEDVQRQMMTRA